MIYSTPSQIVVGIPPNLNTDFFCFVSFFLSFFCCCSCRDILGFLDISQDPDNDIQLIFLVSICVDNISE